eukprot:NODE_788_length_4230_cov_0.560881.p6 type:complete len:117 gc:universal NODE_788_length_4230_cov_0.560881:1127-777(-)
MVGLQDLHIVDLSIFLCRFEHLTNHLISLVTTFTPAVTFHRARPLCFLFMVFIPVSFVCMPEIRLKRWLRKHIKRVARLLELRNICLDTGYRTCIPRRPISSSNWSQTLRNTIEPR